MQATPQSPKTTFAFCSAGSLPIPRGVMCTRWSAEAYRMCWSDRSLHEREEVMTLCSALKSVEHPDDELNLYATLRGSLFAIDDAELFKFKEEHRWINYIKIPAEQDDEATGIREALELLADLHRTPNSRPIASP